MELVAHLNGEKHSDCPQCVHPVIVTYARRLNDRMPDDARNELLLPVILSGKLSGTTELDPQKLAYTCADRAVRVFAGVDCDPIVDDETADAAACSAARSANGAAAVAADAATWIAGAAANAAANACYAEVVAEASAEAASDWKQAVQLLEDLCNCNSEK